MIKKTLCLIISLTIYMSNVQAKIIEISDVPSIKKEMLSLNLGIDDLVTMDVKNVLFAPKDSLLSTHNKTEFKKYYQKLVDKYGSEKAERFKSIILATYEPILVDRSMPEFIKFIQERKIKIIAVTSGDIGKFGSIESREDLRIRTLKNFGIDFSKSFEVGEMLIDQGQDRIPLLFKDGILFGSKASKGESIAKFLEQINFKPKKLVHIDNCMFKLVSIENYCKENGIKYLGIYFTKIYKDKVALLDPKIANKQMEILESQNKWISDLDAKLLLESD